MKLSKKNQRSLAALFVAVGLLGVFTIAHSVVQIMAGAKAAGLKVGAYFFSQAISVDEALEEAVFVLENLGGATLDYPMVYDW